MTFVTISRLETMVTKITGKHFLKKLRRFTLLDFLVSTDQHCFKNRSEALNNDGENQSHILYDPIMDPSVYLAHFLYIKKNRIDIKDYENGAPAIKSEFHKICIFGRSI